MVGGTFPWAVDSRLYKYREKTEHGHTCIDFSLLLSMNVIKYFKFLRLDLPIGMDHNLGRQLCSSLYHQCNTGP